MSNNLNEVENFLKFHEVNMKNNGWRLKNNKEKGYFPKFNIVWNNENIVNTISEVSRADWWRRWLYSTNAKDIGMLYIYFAIFSGISIMPLKNLVIYWNNWNIKNIIKIINIILFNIKSVSMLNMFRDIITYKDYRDFKQELLLLIYLYIVKVKIISLKENYLIIKSRFSCCFHNKGELFKNKRINDQLGPYLAGLIWWFYCYTKRKF